MQACNEQRPKKEIGGLIPDALGNSNDPKGPYNAQQALYQTATESGGTSSKLTTQSSCVNNPK
jgi:hypothetical protein